MSSANHSLETCKTHAKWDRDPHQMTVQGDSKHGKKSSQGGASSELSLHRKIWGVSIQLHMASSSTVDPWTSSTTVTRWSQSAMQEALRQSHSGLWLPTVEVSRVYQKQLMWKGKNSTASPRFSWTELINWNAKNNSYKDRKETRASVSQTSSEKLCSFIQGPPLGSSTLLFSSYSKGLSSWINTTGISQTLSPFSPLPWSACPIHFHLSKLTYPWKTQFKPLFSMDYPWLPWQEAVTFLETQTEPLGKHLPQSSDEENAYDKWHDS